MFYKRSKNCLPCLRLSAAIAILTLGFSAPASASLVLTAAGTSLGFTLSNFATGFGVSGSGCCGPLGIAVAPNGNVIVDDSNNSTNYLFADVNGQNAGQSGGTSTALTSSAFNAFPPAMATSNGAVWTSGGFSGPNADKLIKLNNDGSINTVYTIAGLSVSNGLWTDPATGDLLGTDGSHIYDINVSGATPTYRLVVNVGSDGLTVSPDGSTVYTTSVTGYSIATGAVVFPTLSPGCGGPDGMGVISSSNSLNGDIVVNCNDGTVDLLNTSARTSTVIATGGTRGDYTGADPNNGTLFLTQTNDVFRLSCGSGCGIGSGPSAPEPASVLSLGAIGLCGGLYAILRRKRSQA